MEYRRLGRTDVEVSSVCLGTMTWGKQNTQSEGFEQMDYALDCGINFFDTAELYAIPPERATQGSTETIIGNWFEARKNRDKVILATKVVGRSDQMDWFRDGGALPRANAKNFEEAVDKSLKRLKTDYIDLYQLHWPDRPMKTFGVPADAPSEDEVPIGETLEAFAKLVKAGKVRYIGLSNESAWGTMKFVQIAEELGLPRIVSIQNAYNLVTRAFEYGLSEVALREDVGLLAYSPLAQGYLSGKYRNGALPEGARKTLFERLSRYEGPRCVETVDAYVDLARAHGLDPAQMAIKFCDLQPFVTSTIIGATTMEQLKTDIAAFDVTLSDAVLKGIKEIHRAQPNPAL